ncbi:uncharacterized protein B0I36DRAFT_91699 [Microdochium trichocladiopsis]|uniref:DH domain-containing protein n=1 Tax=Microdochium trichocladiopsis TaxID=1682393 RepID=A0A9P9BSZ2_9PEZI|nr:uncharacterized protein B0I36DRAFT_91699 [Microdochium trichocladiopsis]KAH7035370.1 hypothetical protein B0I36DRAFT_91699 [Microdochium trichocladiopsis]
MNVYVTILASMPTTHEGLRQSINRNLTEIVELHQEMLSELHLVVPCSEFPTADGLALGVHSSVVPTKRHHRWHSLDSVDEHRGDKRRSQAGSGMVADPVVAAEVARIFARRTHRFFVYEEYGAKYEMMIKDLASANQTIPGWESYQRGLEALAASIGSEQQNLDDFKKSLTIADLLVNPIQRVCRYPLLFSELLKYTPACDCPGSHMEIEDVLFRLREATTEINRATDDPDVKASLEKTWLLQDRLAYPSQKMDSASRSKTRSFGQIQLCGVLHVCWQSDNGVEGVYMISLLYKDRLCLATADKGDQRYLIRLCVGLGGVRIEEVDNGRGLQCHTAPFSWKLVFEHDCQLYEIIMTACNPKEESEWRSRLTRPDPEQNFGVCEAAPSDSMSLNIKSLGTIFGKPGTIARRVSIQRATTVGSKSALCQVVLKNTTTIKDSSSQASGSTISRSQSLLTTSPRNTLAPAIAERVRLEVLLADVWSRETLPFPGMTSRSRSEHLVRNSASTVMRKLSVASISSSFSKRTTPLGPVAKKQDSGRVVPRTSCGEYTSSVEDIEEPEPGLPMIRDEAERSKSSLPHALDSGAASDLGPHRDSVPRFKSAKSYEVLRRGEDMLTCGSPILRTASVNSSRHKRLSIKSVSSRILEKENVVEHRAVPVVREQHGPLGKKWARVKTLNRELRSSGLRSLFR